MKENQVIEWKQSWRDKYLKWICGFANAQGGTLAILGYLQETTVRLPHWAPYQDALRQLAIGVEHHRG